MGIVGGLFGLLFLAAGIVSLVCLIMVIVKMFQNDQSTLGIVTIILTLCTGIVGTLVAFVIGWMNAAKWNIRNLMLAFTGALIGWIVFGILSFTMGILTAFQEMDNGFPQNNFEVPEFEAPEF